MDVRSYINVAQQGAATEIQRATVCLFGVYGDVPIPHGTGVLVRIDDAHFIFTAAHVAALAKMGTPMTIADFAQPGDFITLAGAAIVASSGEGGSEDAFDLAVVRLPDGTAAAIAKSKRFLRLSDIDSKHRATRGTWYYLQGFPSEPALPDMQARKVRARFLRYGGTRNDPPEPDFVDGLYIDVAARNVGLIDETGAPAVITTRDGVSGCGLWWLFDVDDLKSGSWSPESLRYVGIVHTWRTDREYIRGTRVEYALQMIAAQWPDLKAAMLVSLNLARPLQKLQKLGFTK